jgi:hypothetical protein
VNRFEEVLIRTGTHATTFSQKLFDGRKKAAEEILKQRPALFSGEEKSLLETISQSRHRIPFDTKVFGNILRNETLQKDKGLWTALATGGLVIEEKDLQQFQPFFHDLENDTTAFILSVIKSRS